ncbi:MAG: helix-turn-helix domain-containing protein [Butyricimonas paravirosa]
MTATVSEKADVFIATKESVFRQMGRYESFLRNFLSVSANRTTFPYRAFAVPVIQDDPGKIDSLYSGTGLPDKKKVLLGKSQQELAEYFGVTRPALAKVLYELADEGMISVNRREIIILDRRRCGGP